MGKFDGILICTDLDGTLLRNDKSVSEENKKAIEYFKSEGGIFTFVTGRMPYYSKEAFEKANPNIFLSSLIVLIEVSSITLSFRKKGA